MEDYQLKVKQLGFDSYEEAVYYNAVAGYKLGTIFFDKMHCLNVIQESKSSGKEFLNKPRNEQLYELLRGEVDMLEEMSDYYLEDRELKNSFEYLEYYILELKKYHFNQQKEQQKSYKLIKK